MGVGTSGYEKVWWLLVLLQHRTQLLEGDGAGTEVCSANSRFILNQAGMSAWEVLG